LLHNQDMTKKVLISRLGAGSITVALIAALPGCNLALIPVPTDCVGQPSSRGMSSADCSGNTRDATLDGTRDATADTASDAAGIPVGDAVRNEGGGDRP
jgi:hypothetical protein